MDHYKYIGCYKENDKSSSTSNSQSLNLVPGVEYTYNTCKQKAILSNSAVFGMQFNSDKNTVQCFISDPEKDYKTQLDTAIKYGSANLKDKINLEEDFNFNSLNSQCGKMKNGYTYGGSGVYATYSTDLALSLCDKHINLDNIQPPNYFTAKIHNLNTRFDNTIKSLRTTYFNYLSTPTVNNTKLYHTDLYALKKINLEYETIQLELKSNIDTVKKRISQEENNIDKAKTKKYTVNNKLKKLYSNDNAAIGDLNDKQLQHNISIIENIFLLITMTSALYFYYKIRFSQEQ